MDQQHAAQSSVDTGAVGSEVDSRRIRKRATDRKSQKKHRERQRSYIQQLEASLESLTSSKDTDDGIATLLASRDHYKSRYEDALVRIVRVRELLCVAKATDDKDNDPTLFDDPVPVAAAAATAPSQTSSITGANSFPSIDTSDLVFLPSTSLADTDGCVGPLTANVTSTPTVDSLFETFALGYENPVCYGSSDDSGSLQLSFNTLDVSYQQQPLPLHLPCPPPGGTSSSMDGMIDEHLHLCLPRYSPPVGPGDRQITSMLVEASHEYAANSFDLTPPTLQRLLSPKADLLAFRLYNYIAAYGPMPMHVMLAIFWTQYLLLRVRMSYFPGS